MNTTKICSRCTQELPVSNFWKDKTTKDGFCRSCKVCLLGRPMKRQLVIQGFKKCFTCRQVKSTTNEFNKDSSRSDQLCINCKKCLHYIHVQGRLQRREYDKVYRAEHRLEKNRKDRLRRQLDPQFRLASNLRSRLNMALKAKSWHKTTSFTHYIGCTLNELKKHIENHWVQNMTWNNWGKGVDKWNIDHIMPLDSAKTSEELYKLCHYTNLQPLWETDNLSKSNKI